MLIKNVIELICMHKTDAGDDIKILRKRARQSLKKANKARAAGLDLGIGAAHEKAEELEIEAAENLAKADDLHDLARFQDINVWKMEKSSRKGGVKKYQYWMASWRQGSRVKNIHIGSCRKISYSAAMRKARKLKAEFLGIGAEEETPAEV